MIDAKSFVKINFLVTFSLKNSKIYLFRPYVFKKVVFFLYILMKIIFFTLKIYLFAPKLVSKHFLQQKMQKVSQKSIF